MKLQMLEALLSWRRSGEMPLFMGVGYLTSFLGVVLAEGCWKVRISASAMAGVSLIFFIRSPSKGLSISLPLLILL